VLVEPQLQGARQRFPFWCLHVRRATECQLGGIAKRGDTHLRTLLIQGAKSAVMTAHRRPDRISAWAAALRDRSGWQQAVVALANKNARILWAVMTRGEALDANHLSIKPAPNATPA